MVPAKGVVHHVVLKFKKGKIFGKGWKPRLRLPFEPRNQLTTPTGQPRLIATNRQTLFQIIRCQHIVIIHKEDQGNA